ncbi:DUF3089 domain-containing protein [Novosphingobium sp.]|uniref:DUF3089 domain-containing protein n=1 Tax=Novosphingobium sp. TaxID=1874826 RepID=UPI0035B11369
MARKFLYVFAFCVIVYFFGRIALTFYPETFTRLAFAPTAAFEAQPDLPANAYAEPKRWLTRPGAPSNPARWNPPGAAAGQPVHAAVFFVHPTTYLERDHWNAPDDNARANELAVTVTRAMASPFGGAEQLWAPRYRQASLGTFLSDGADASKALDLAHHDVTQAFDAFVAGIPPTMPIVLVGHSQGAYHLRRLLAERIAGTPLEGRIAAVYLIGWPISIEHDLPKMGLPACAAPGQAGCVMSWLSFGDPADPAMMLRAAERMPGLDGQALAGGHFLCSNPLTGAKGGSAPASANLGSLVLDAKFTGGTIKPGLAAANCRSDGMLGLGGEPAMGPILMPGNNYHVYDIPLFWVNLRDDFSRRVVAWQAKH